MENFKIGNKIIGEGQPVFLIAEVGINHDGNIEKAKKLIQKARWAGADAVKFQTFKTDALWSREGIIKILGEKKGKEILGLFDKVQLSREDHFVLKEVADKEGITFLSTPFDHESVDLLMQLRIKAIKIASGDITFLSLIDYISTKNIPVFLSTGMATMEEVTRAVDIFRKNKNDSLALLQCTSSYPAPEDEIDLGVLEEYEKNFSVPAGLSDHSIGTFVPLIAAAYGARVIEKHFTLNKNDRGPDHKLSLEPQEFHELVKDIRRTEEIIGTKEKYPRPSESETKKIGRRALYTRKTILEGEVLNREYLVCKRPCLGIPAEREEETLNKISKKTIPKDAPLYHNNFKDDK